MPFALVGDEVIITNSRYALVGYFITSYPTRAHGIIVIRTIMDFKGFEAKFAFVAQQTKLAPIKQFSISAKKF